MTAPTPRRLFAMSAAAASVAAAPSAATAATTAAATAAAGPAGSGKLTVTGMGTLDVQMTEAEPPGPPSIAPIHVSGSWTC